MNKTRLFFPALLLLLSLFVIQKDSFSQMPCTVWSKVYNGPSNQQDSAVAICVNQSGFVFVTGWSIGGGTADIVTIRYNPATGDTVWVARFNGAANAEDKPTSITCDGNAVYVTGWSFAAANNRNVITIKYDVSNGAQLWANTYNGPGNGGDYGYSVAVDGSGNVYSAGRTDNGGAQKFLVLKYDAAGNVVAPFPFIYTGAQSTLLDEAHSVKVDGSGNIYVTGKSGLAGASDYMTMKVNSSAVDQWVKKHNGTQNSDDNALVLLLDNGASNVYVAGWSFRTGQQQDYVTIKYSASTGDSTAAAVYTGPAGSTDAITSATIDNSNNVYVTGYSSAIGTALDFATIKYNSNLAQQWIARTSGPTNEQPQSISVDNASGNVYVTGAILSGNYDYLTIGYFSDGSVYWQKSEIGTGSANDFGSYVIAADSTSVFVTGSANFTPNGTGYYTLRYAACTGIEPISNLVPSNYALMQNYPNPFNPATTIRFDIPKSSFVKISVYDVTGRQLEILAAENVRAGQYEVKWDASKYSSGVYFYSLTAGDFVQTKKMILTK